MDKGIEEHDSTQPKKPVKASGRPGDEPRWTSGAKTLVGTAASARSRIWFTIGLGTINEIYFPDVDQANTRSIRFLVTGDQKFFSDEAWDCEHTVTWLQSGVPGCRIESRCKAGRYTITKEIITDPIRDTLMMQVEFKSTTNDENLKLYLVVDPQMGDQGADNHAWIGEYKGVSMLFAQRGRSNLAVASAPPMLEASVGYKGKSDGHTVLGRHEELPDANTAPEGNVCSTARMDISNGGKLLISLACGSDPTEAAQQARAGTLQEFDKTKALFLQEWVEKQATYDSVEDLSGHALDMYRVSTAVLETHQSKRFPGAFVASLSLPWGFAHTDKDVGGYHVLWPRDLCETAMGKLASGDARSARSALFYLSCTQDSDGGWSQNMWLDGTMHWGAIQMDGMALPILLADKLRQENALDGYDPNLMVLGATKFLLKHGPVTQQDRWESTPGYSTYTMATEVAALLAAADFAEAAEHPDHAVFLRETADAWNDAIDELIYVEDTPLAREHGVTGYYMRMTPPERIEKDSVGGLEILMPNHHFGSKHNEAIDIVSPDALALVRFGVRAADDPRMIDTVKVIDATLKRETTTGATWTRSTKDGYGETEDGAPFLKVGIGRGWPLLGGERGHYELAAGNKDAALERLKTMARQTSEAGMIPEQVWDAPDIPERLLFNGHPAGSGMPLVWAHSEYLKLLVSLHKNAVWDMPTQTVERYLRQKTVASFQIWTPKQRRGFVAQGKNLRIDLEQSMTVTWSCGDTTNQCITTDTGLGIHTAMLKLSSFEAGQKLKVELTQLSEDGEGKKDSFSAHIN
jgi:glucoamylase